MANRHPTILIQQMEKAIKEYQPLILKGEIAKVHKLDNVEIHSESNAYHGRISVEGTAITCLEGNPSQLKCKLSAVIYYRNHQVESIERLVLTPIKNSELIKET